MTTKLFGEISKIFKCNLVLIEVFDPVGVFMIRLPGKQILNWDFGFRELHYAIWNNMLKSRKNRMGQREH